MPPYRIEWLDEAKTDVRALDRPTAMRLFEGVLRFARTGSGDVNALHGDMAGAFRLRLGELPRAVHARKQRHAHLWRPSPFPGLPLRLLHGIARRKHRQFGAKATHSLL